MTGLVVNKGGVEVGGVEACALPRSRYDVWDVLLFFLLLLILLLSTTLHYNTHHGARMVSDRF